MKASVIGIFLSLFGLLTSSVAFAQEGIDLPEAQVQWREFRSMPKETQRKIHKVYTEFLKLSEEHQESTREWVQEWLKLSSDERATMRHRLQRWSRMNEEKKKALKRKWAALSGTETAE